MLHQMLPSGDTKTRGQDSQCSMPGSNGSLATTIRSNPRQNFRIPAVLSYIPHPKKHDLNVYIISEPNIRGATVAAKQVRAAIVLLSIGN
jgi:hypothetical protein